MSSDPPGRYQSRLFNFLNRQSLRMTERLERAVRHLKVAAVWGAQILVYPVYLVVQASLSAGRQLSATVQAGWPQLKESTTKEDQKTPPAADTPIQRVLSEVKTLDLQVERLKVGRLVAQNWSLSEDLTQLEILNQSSNLQPSNLQPSNLQPSNLQPSNLQPTTLQPSNLQPTTLQPSTQTHLSQTAPDSSEPCWVIQGVASLLATRTLVLTTVHNELLDILTPQQQQKLSSRISWEVADLLRQRRIAQSLDKTATPRLATLARPGVLLPVRLFWQVMAWVQTSPVAISANLFQESTLVYRRELEVRSLRLERSNLQPSNLPYPSSKPSANGNAFSEQLSTPGQGALAFLDRTFTELESHQLVPGSEVMIAWSERTVRTIGECTHKLLKPLQNQFLKPETLDESSEVSQTKTVGIQALIYAAIDYFFGRRSSTLPGTLSQEQLTGLANYQGEAPQLLGSHSTAQLPGALPPDVELTNTTEADPWLTWGDLFGRPNASSGNAQNSKVQIPEHKTQAELPEAFNSKVPIRPRNSVWGIIKRYVSLKQPLGKRAAPNTGEAMVKRPKSVAQIAKLRNSINIQSRQIQDSNKGTASTKVKNPSSATVNSHRTSVSPAKETTAITTSSSETNLEPAHDWIETLATPTGYVKHPLERLLESVDLAMLWLEELAVKVWRWVQQLGRRG